MWGCMLPQERQKGQTCSKANMKIISRGYAQNHPHTEHTPYTPTHTDARTHTHTHTHTPPQTHTGIPLTKQESCKSKHID